MAELHPPPKLTAADKYPFPRQPLPAMEEAAAECVRWSGRHGYGEPFPSAKSPCDWSPKVYITTGTHYFRLTWDITGVYCEKIFREDFLREV